MSQNEVEELTKILDKYFPDDMDPEMYHPNLPEFVEAVLKWHKSAISEFAKRVEKEVIENCPLDFWEDWYVATRKYGGTVEEYLRLVEITQRITLQKLVEEETQ